MNAECAAHSLGMDVRRDPVAEALGRMGMTWEDLALTDLEVRPGSELVLPGEPARLPASTRRLESSNLEVLQRIAGRGARPAIGRSSVTIVGVRHLVIEQGARLVLAGGPTVLLVDVLDLIAGGRVDIYCRAHVAIGVLNKINLRSCQEVVQ